jgi:hypothetical protein
MVKQIMPCEFSMLIFRDGQYSLANSIIDHPPGLTFPCPFIAKLTPPSWRGEFLTLIMQAIKLAWTNK